MMDKVQKSSNYDCYTPSSELFRIYDGFSFVIKYGTIKCQGNPVGIKQWVSWIKLIGREYQIEAHGSILALSSFICD
jgi:hypothetical protein